MWAMLLLWCKSKRDLLFWCGSKQEHRPRVDSYKDRARLGIRAGRDIRTDNGVRIGTGIRLGRGILAGTDIRTGTRAPAPAPADPCRSPLVGDALALVPIGKRASPTSGLLQGCDGFRRLAPRRAGAMA